MKVLVWSLLIVFFVTFLLLSIALLAAWLVLQKRAAQSAEESLEGQTLLKNDELSSISLWQSLLAHFDFVEIMKSRIAQADLAWSVGRVTLAMLLGGSISMFLLMRIAWIPLWASTGLSVMATLVPYLYILRRRRRRFERFREAFPDALDSLSRALRAGHPLIGALDMLANEADPPVSTEIRKTFGEANLGMPWDQALSSLGERVPIPEVHLFVAAVQIHARTGGRLSDVISRMTESMREQVALTGEVRAVAAHGKLTGFILTLVPIGIALTMMVVSPTYIGVLLAHPYGKHMIAAAIGCLILAHFVMKRLVDIRV
jgi:tight adherence protein B